ncbi:hypothetical protein BXZ70DRAFT_911353 [Cristinia sonorae]|uniref:Uncharacterized protein n=1 Tax=Cristinia sonorae TaxID=1940300 RepID=A0A8K0XJU1_9AGAR|nr:hypothetical protein BXZ70DRAFT_911353 [Cristinia sonorae]
MYDLDQPAPFLLQNCVPSQTQSNTRLVPIQVIECEMFVPSRQPLTLALCGTLLRLMRFTTAISDTILVIRQLSHATGRKLSLPVFFPANNTPAYGRQRRRNAVLGRTSQIVGSESLQKFLHLEAPVFISTWTALITISQLHQKPNNGACVASLDHHSAANSYRAFNCFAWTIMRLHCPLPPSLVIVMILYLDTTGLTSLSPWWRALRSQFFVSGKLMNKTVDDTSFQIAYVPAAAWRTSEAPCAGCMKPDQGIAYKQTWHVGTHVLPTADSDDIKDPGADDVASNSASQSLGDHDHAVEGSGGGDGGRDETRDGPDHEGMFRRGSSSAIASPRVLVQRHNGDNPSSVSRPGIVNARDVDVPVFAHVNFTGSAVYVYAIVPMPPALENASMAVNLSFTLDSQPDGRFSHIDTQIPTSASTVTSGAYQPNVLVYARSGLPESFHSLRIDVDPDSVFLLDYVTYSQHDVLVKGGNNTGNDSSTTLDGQSPVGTPDAKSNGPSANDTSPSAPSKSHNLATFGGAVGGSVGLLAVLSLSLAFSIYRRRALARRRDRRLREMGEHAQNFRDSFHTDASEDGPPMEGPAPFVPRYFPGTVPVAPPPYLPPVSPDSAEVTTPLLTSVSPVHTPLASTSWNVNRSGDVSYAERPPPTPPPEGEDDGFYAPPPSFSIAIASPVPAIFAQLSNVPAALASHSAAYLAQLRAQASSRQPSLTNLAEQGMTQRHPSHPSFSDSHPPSPISRPVSIRSNHSSLRQGPSRSLNTADVPTESGSSSSDDNVSTHISNRSPSSASVIPPSIPPSSEGTDREREAQQRRASGFSGGEGSSSI